MRKYPEQILVFCTFGGPLCQGGPSVAESARASSTPLILCNLITAHLFIHVFVYSARYEVLTALLLRTQVFWDVTLGEWDVVSLGEWFMAFHRIIQYASSSQAA